MQPDAETLAFVMPGFVHRIGNGIFTVQGLAQMPERPITHATVLAATDRISLALQVARTLIGPALERPAPAAQLLEVIADLTRLPLRERGQTLAIAGVNDQGPPASGEVSAPIMADPATFCPAVVTVIRLLAEALPPGTTGGVRLRLAAANGVVQVGVTFVPAVGELPFPLDWGAIVAAVEATLDGPRQGLGIDVADGVRLRFWSVRSGLTDGAGQA